jgi:hypothetical protein
MPMTLQNLRNTGQLAEHETDAVQVRQMLDSVRRNIDDARTETISAETRLAAAYRAIMQTSMVALWANGYRPVKSSPGHHMIMIQSLPISIGLETDRMLLLDTFRVKRNAIDYSGEAVDAVSVESCIAAAERLMERLYRWLKRHRPELI